MINAIALRDQQLLKTFMSSSNPTPHITLSILKNYYPFVVDLRAYFSHVLQPSNLDHVRLSSPESVSYTCLLDTAYVASSQPLNKSFSYVLPDFDMREVGKVLTSYLNSQ